MSDAGNILWGGAFTKILNDDLRNYHRKYFRGEIKRPCDDDCPDGCDGRHNYEMPVQFENLFKDLTK